MSGKISAKPGEKTGGKNLASSLAEAAAGLKAAVRTAKNARSTAMQNPRDAATQGSRDASMQNPSGAAAQAVRGEKSSRASLSSGLVATRGESEKLTSGKDEKSDGKKKAARPISHPASVTAETGIEKSKTAEIAAASPKHIEAAAAQAQNPARAAAAPQIAAVHVADLRKRTADKSADAGAQRIAQAAPAAKETGTLFAPQQSAPRDIEVPRKAAPASPAAPPTLGA